MKEHTLSTQNDLASCPAVIHVPGEITLHDIKDGWSVSWKNGYFTVCWSLFFAYLHQFDEQTQFFLIDECTTGKSSNVTI